MKINIEIIENVNKDEVMKLYKEANWCDESDTTAFIPIMVKNSFCFVGAFINNELIGMGRAISDINSDAYIQDIVVLKKYRNNGIGHKIVQKIIDYLKSKDISWIGLIGEPGTQSFYEKLKFSVMENHIPMKLNLD